MSRRLPTRRTIVLVTSLLLLVFIGISATLIARHDTKQQQATRFSQVHDELTNMAASVKTKQSYSTLPKTERQTFLNKQAAVYALDMRHQKATPDTLRATCVENAQDDLQNVETRLHNELSADEFQTYVPIFEHTQATMRANCYANFDPTGKENIPPMIPHP